MTRGDRIVVAVVALLAAVSWPATMLLASGRGDVAVVTAPAGASEIALSPDRTVDVQGVQGVVRLEISGGSVRVTDVSCPDRLCVAQGRVSSKGAALVCVPNGVTIRVGGGDDALDAVVR